MRGSSQHAFALLIALVAVSAAANSAGAVYWFQSGAFSGSAGEFNSGVSASIQSVWQNVSDGSLGFWVGENLNNGAFVQVGYQIVNMTGYYPTNCNIGGCSGNTYLTAGKPTWFWEYFPAGYSGTSFLGGVGPDGSSGANGTFNTYSLNSSGNVWSAYFDNRLLGSVDLGTSNSGTNPPTAVGEVAATHTNTQTMQKVAFRNLAYYSGSGLMMVPKGYTYISYGKGSSTNLKNPYGVGEVDSFANYFQVGSALPQVNNSVLWSSSYRLSVVSKYGNISGSANYSAFSTAQLSAPGIVNISRTARAVFAGWIGSGLGSYTGPSASVSLTMSNNITETAQWTLQYYIGVNSTYAISGAGWYNAGSTAVLYPASTITSIGNGARTAFAGWSNGAKSNTTTVSVTGAQTLTAFWVRQYLVNATSPYGTVSGTGWYSANSVATLTLSSTVAMESDGTRIAFSSWSNGSASSALAFRVTAPVALSAGFGMQYLVGFAPKDAYGNAVPGVAYYNVDGTNTTGPTYLFGGITHTVGYIHYKGARIRLNYTFSVSAPQSVSFSAPIYNVSISAVSLIGTPLNASVNVTFENNTRLVTYTGRNGTIRFADVPYGAVAGYVQYAGVKRDILANGGSVSVLMITPSVFAVIGAVVVAAVLSVRYMASRRRTAVQ